jgi:hypothetical protein
LQTALWAAKELGIKKVDALAGFWLDIDEDGASATFKVTHARCWRIQLEVAGGMLCACADCGVLKACARCYLSIRECARFEILHGQALPSQRSVCKSAESCLIWPAGAVTLTPAHTDHYSLFIPCIMQSCANYFNSAHDGVQTREMNARQQRQLKALLAAKLRFRGPATTVHFG